MKKDLSLKDLTLVNQVKDVVMSENGIIIAKF